LVSQDSGEGDANLAFLGYEGEVFLMEHISSSVTFHQVTALEEEEDDEEEDGASHMENVRECVLGFMRTCR
jgi:putative IMPACT (imprinted ancient) family translation regulator